MRFPRTNLTGAEEISAEVEGEQLQEHAGEKPTAPIWQSNFSLAPNVRFTRTPENLINPKRVPAPPFRTPPLALQERVAAEIGASVEQQAPVVANAPVEVYEAEIAPAIEVQPTATALPLMSKRCRTISKSGEPSCSVPKAFSTVWLSQYP